MKVGGVLSTPREVLGGVPQGSLLGVLLFNIAIDDFESPSPDVTDYGPSSSFIFTEQAVNAPQPRTVCAEPTPRVETTDTCRHGKPSYYRC